MTKTKVEKMDSVELLMNVTPNETRVALVETGVLKGVILLDNIRHLIFESDYYDKIAAIELMQPAPATIVSGKDKMSTVMDKFQHTGAWNLPVVHSDGRFYGFISKSKLLSIYRRKLIYFTQ